MLQICSFMKNLFYRLSVTCILLFNTGMSIFLYGQGASPLPTAEQNPTTLGAWISQLMEAWKQGDDIWSIVEQGEKSQAAWELAHKAANLMKNSPLLDQYLSMVQKYYNTYDEILALYKYDLTTQPANHSEVIRRVQELYTMSEHTYKDIDFMISFATNPNNWTGSEMERYALLEKYYDKLNDMFMNLQRMRNKRNRDKDTAVVVETIDALNDPDKAENDPVVSRLADMTQEEANEAMRSAIEAVKGREGLRSSVIIYAEGDGDALTHAEMKMSKTTSPGIKLGMLLIGILSLLYIPYNMWKVNSGERQAQDGLIRIVIGLLFGFVGLIFLNAIF